MSETYYDILGVNKTASIKDIKKTYRKLARKYHPDVNPDDKEAEAKFKSISEAYAVLGNPEKRKEYDRVGHEAFKAGFDPGQAYDRNGKWYAAGEQPNEEFLFDLGDIFGGAFKNFSQRARKGNDAEASLEISFTEAVKGATVRFSISRETVCSLCSGEGGVGGKAPCAACAGRGVTQKAETIDVRIPPGADDGSRLRVPGKGAPGMNGGAPGDLYINIRVKPHPLFERKGYDIYGEIPLSIAEAALGGRVSVETIDGPTIMKIPTGTQGGQVFRLKGKGVPRRSGKGRGDHYVKVRIKIPGDLSPDEEKLIRELDRFTETKDTAKTGTS